MTKNIESGMPESSESALEREIKRQAIESGQIKVSVIDFGGMFGKLENYSGEGIVEVNNERYKVIGHPVETSTGQPIKKSSVEIYKMRPWQE